MSTEIKYPLSAPEIWGGIECTFNRVGDDFRDQLASNGHYTRAGDINTFSTLGIKKMRYPVLWENHPEDIQGTIDWSWSTKQLNTLREKNIVPIAGLIHHGSGPLDTNLLDDKFPERLAKFAGQVAGQFPWLEYYTPVNEPLTTARFSGLYGFWYPHHKETRSFLTMLLNQVKAIVLSMKAIRLVNPHAKLIQTEDLSKVHSTAMLAYQAVFENHRRWLTGDLLCGKVTPLHPLWQYFLDNQIDAATLTFFIDNQCPPSIIGHNYYVTSERFLDEAIQNYPAEERGGNGMHVYADAPAVRVHRMEGLETLLLEAWDRYGLPMALTECYLNCTREEQMRWLKYAWEVCCSLGSRIPIAALTAWSLTGSTDWDTLLLEKNNRYECGVFDIRQGTLRQTMLVDMIRAYAQGLAYSHRLLHDRGWWERTNNDAAPAARVLLLCHTRDITRPYVRICEERYITPDIINVDSTEEGQIDATLRKAAEKYWAIIYIAPDDKGYYDALPLIYQASLPVMIIAAARDLIKDLPAGFLQVYFNGSLSPEFAQASMDLLIDNAHGRWEVMESVPRKIPSAQLHPFLHCVPV